MPHFIGLLIAVTLPQLNAKGIAQMVTLAEKDASLKKVFTHVKKQTGYYFAGGRGRLDKTIIAIKVRNSLVEQVLECCFKDQPLTYTMIDKPIDVEAKVINEKGEPVTGATVQIKGTQNATSANANGEFGLLKVEPNAIFVLTGVNMEAIEEKVKGRAVTAMNVLDQVVVKAYGKTSQSFNTGILTL